MVLSKRKFKNRLNIDTAFFDIQKKVYNSVIENFNSTRIFKRQLNVHKINNISHYRNINIIRGIDKILELYMF